MTDFALLTLFIVVAQIFTAESDPTTPQQLPLKMLISQDHNDIELRLKGYVPAGKPWTLVSRGDLDINIINYVRAGTESGIGKVFSNLMNVQDCQQRIKITVLDEDEHGKDAWFLRDDFLVSCGGDESLQVYRKYQLSYGRLIHLYGYYRLLIRLQDGECIEREYGYRGRSDKRISKKKCDHKIERIHSFEGTMRNIGWHLTHYST